MALKCEHTGMVRDVTPSARGCEDCLKIGSPWVHLRLCRICGHVGCCDRLRTGTPPRISTPPAILSSRATIRLKAGAGVMSTRPR